MRMMKMRMQWHYVIFWQILKFKVKSSGQFSFSDILEYKNDSTWLMSSIDLANVQLRPG